MNKAAIKRKINNALWKLTSNKYHDAIPNGSIGQILSEYGLAMKDGIYCGADGESHEHVGRGIYLSLTWHKMQSGRYEIVAYVS